MQATLQSNLPQSNQSPYSGGCVVGWRPLSIFLVFETDQPRRKMGQPEVWLRARHLGDPKEVALVGGFQEFWKGSSLQVRLVLFLVSFFSVGSVIYNHPIGSQKNHLTYHLLREPGNSVTRSSPGGVLSLVNMYDVTCGKKAPKKWAAK